MAQQIASMYAEIGAKTNTFEQGMKDVKGGLSDVEKTLKGTRSQFDLLNKDLMVGGRSIGSFGDALKGMGLDIPLNPMQLLGQAVSTVARYTIDATNAAADYSLQMN